MKQWGEHYEAIATGWTGAPLDAGGGADKVAAELLRIIIPCAEGLGQP